MGLFSSTSIHHARVWAVAHARRAQFPRRSRSTPRWRRARCALRFYSRSLSSLAPPPSFAVYCVPGRRALPTPQQSRYPTVRAVQRTVLHLLFVPGHVGVCTLAVVFCVCLVRTRERVPV